MTGSVIRPPPPTALRKSPLLDWIAQVTVPPVGGGTAVAGFATTAAAADGAADADAAPESPSPQIAVTAAARPAARRRLLFALMINPSSPSSLRPGGRAALTARETR